MSDIGLLSMDGPIFILRWIHFMSGVLWIGLLYYFNFVQGEFFKETDAGTKSAAIQKLVPRALWWFRWAAMLTFLSGLMILMNKGHSAGWAVYSSSWGIFILTGSLLGTIMFLNVWLVIWPNQQIVINSTQTVAKGGQADPRAVPAGARAALASRTNVLFSIPMLFFMGAASHLPLTFSAEPCMISLCGTLAVVIGLIEFNALKGSKMGPMTSVAGVIHMGLLFTLFLYAVIEVCC